MVRVPIGDGHNGRGNTQAKKDLILEYVKDGKTVADALRALGMSRQNYEYYRRTDEVFKDRIDAEFAKRKHGLSARAAVVMPEFPEFCQKYLDTTMFNHHLQWFDMIEGREPRNLHAAQHYVPAERNRLLINTPPEHAKSTTITMNYVVYRICEDPNIRILIVSKTRDMAKKFLRGVKDRLTGRMYQQLQTDFAPPGGFEANSAGWTQDAIYVSGDARDSGEKDPTVQALGIGGHIYGARADIIILDDCVVGSNAHEYEKQIDWIQGEVQSRLDIYAGILLVVGTRMSPVDLYGELLKPAYYVDGESPWTYLTQPAVLESGDDPTKWVTLWPKSNRAPVSLKARESLRQDEEGLWPKWDGPSLAKVRKSMGPDKWAMMYQQEQTSEHTVFKTEDVVGCVNGLRKVGPMARGAVGHRDHGMDGLYVVAGLDPAMAGCTAAVVIGMDRMSGKRYVLDVWNKAAMRPDEIRGLMKDWTVKYNVQEWRVEKNAFQIMLTQDREVREFLAQRGAILKEHFTGNNKWDVDFGVASMSMLFEGWQEKRNTIELPSRERSEATKELVTQLTTWFPETKNKTDCVMALWFAEIRCRELWNQEWDSFHVNNPYLAPRDREHQLTVDIDMMLSGGYQAPGGGTFL